MIKQINQSDAIAYNKSFLQTLLTLILIYLKRLKAHRKEYARLELAIKDGKCEEQGCQIEMDRLQYLTNAPTVFYKFYGKYYG